MPRVLWPLQHGRPCVQIVLTLTRGGHPWPLTVIADTGGGSLTAGFDLVLSDVECKFCGGKWISSMPIVGAYAGSFPLYELRVRVPALGFDQVLRAVGVPLPPTGFDGVACFSFLNQFTYGNFGDPGRKVLAGRKPTLMRRFAGPLEKR
jgi:hypothetical protein